MRLLQFSQEVEKNWKKKKSKKFKNFLTFPPSCER